MNQVNYILLTKKKSFDDLTSPQGIVDMFTNSDDMLLRARNSFDLESFLFAYRQSNAEKEEFMESVIARIKMDMPDNLFDTDKARKAIKEHLNIDISIPLGPNGLGPDYSSIKDTVIKGNKLIYHHGNPAVAGIKKIKYSSVLDIDFSLAYKELGLSGQEIEEVKKLYVWHHLDDYNPKTGEGTMQLVLRELHNPGQEGYGYALRHTGGVAMWRYYYFPYAPDMDIDEFY